MKTLEEQISIMQEALNGREIERKLLNGGANASDWHSPSKLVFNWSMYDYRVKEDWLTPEELEQLPVDTLLLVSDEKDATPDERYFSHYENGIIQCFYNGATSQTYKLEHYGGWRYAKLCKNAKSIIQWHTNTGKKPDCREVMVKYNNDSKGVGRSEEFKWSIGDDSFDIREYTIIE
jgi:hypothetical protein